MLWGRKPTVEEALGFMLRYHADLAGEIREVEKQLAALRREVAEIGRTVIPDYRPPNN